MRRIVPDPCIRTCQAVDFLWVFNYCVWLCFCSLALRFWPYDKPVCLRYLTCLCYDSAFGILWLTVFCSCWTIACLTLILDSLIPETLMTASSCTGCAQSKVPRHHPAGNLLPLPTPNWPWSHIAIDFLTDLPQWEDMNLSSIWHTWRHRKWPRTTSHLPSMEKFHSEFNLRLSSSS